MTGTIISLRNWAKKIDNRIGPISGRDADTLAEELRAAALRIESMEKTLELYANLEIYKPHPHGPGFDRRADLYQSAKAALAKARGEL